MYGLENKNSDVLSDEIIEYLDSYFEDRLENYSVYNITDEPYTMFSISFKAYNYFIVVLNYDRGSFGCAIDGGSAGISLKNSQKWRDTADMDIFLRELEQQIELRIPDKFLEFYGRKKN